MGMMATMEGDSESERCGRLSCRVTITWPKSGFLLDRRDAEAVTNGLGRYTPRSGLIVKHTDSALSNCRLPRSSGLAGDADPVPRRALSSNHRRITDTAAGRIGNAQDS
jgi:hypothetical protein